ncbi:MAG: PadR family transcriptional regulator [Spirochaetes bacterium]|nr:PadR family transcriptional regulator [Spirochaetota bacterium]
MDIQLKKGILDVLVLSILKRDDLYGYKLSEQINGIVSIAETALYPVLRRLKEQGLLTTYSVEHNGRLRKYYSITESGKVHLDERIEDLAELRKIIETIIEGAEKK